VGHFALLDPDSDPDSEYGTGSTDLIESGSETLVLRFLFNFSILDFLDFRVKICRTE
jgi:hypothetical protein